jgi:hypothetical protein
MIFTATGAVHADPFAYNGGLYFQNFDSLVTVNQANSAQGAVTAVPTTSGTLDGWFYTDLDVSPLADSAARFTASDGSANTGSTYSFGSASSSERALGLLLSGTESPVIGFRAVNNTASTINTLSLSYNAEHWRTTTTGPDSINFSYALTTDPLTSFLRTGSFSPVASLNASFAAGAAAGPLDGNASGNFTAVNATISTSLGWDPGETLWIRWTDTDISGSDHGIGVDNLSLIDAASAPTPPAPTSSTPPPTVTAATIMQIQGTGTSSTYAGNNVMTTGVVTRVNDNGFYIQDAVGDGNTSTSDGIFVFTGGAPTVTVGNAVEVTGTVSEFFSRTQIGGTVTVQTTGAGPAIAPTPISFPVTTLADLERFEGMKIEIDQPMALAEYFNLDRFGEVRLSAQLFDSFTDANAPSVTGYAAHVDQVARNSIILDDGRSGSNLHPIPLVGDPLPPNNDPVKIIRRGDSFDNVVGTLDFEFGNWSIDPTQDPTITSTNPRPTSAPDVGGSLKIATFNLLNYFNGNGQGGGFPTSRGATTFADFLTQTDKAVAAIRGTGAHILGLEELENDGGGALSAIQSLVNALNASATGSEHWAFVNTGVVGTDVITAGFIYRTDVASTVGSHAVLDVNVDPNFFTGVDGNRPAIAQTFMHLSSGEILTLAVNHLKSKSGTGTGLNADQLDGQGNWNHRRTLAAMALANWLLGDPTGSGDPDFLILGDLNAYLMEDPIQALINAGYTDLLDYFQGSSAYSYVFDGQTGSLDHLMANASLLAQITGAAAWHINADEPDVYDYNTGFGKSSAYTSAGEFRTSDHDPIIIGLNFTPIPSPAAAAFGAAMMGLMLLQRRRPGRD